MKNSAIIVIDMQNGFLDHTNSWYTQGSELIINTILKVCSKFPKENVFLSGFTNNLSNKKEATKFISTSIEARIIDPLKNLVNENNIYMKNTYSIFKINELHNKLGLFDTIYICGLEADACVLFSSAEAYDLFLNFKVIRDAVAGFTGFGGYDQFVLYYQKHFGNCLINSIDIE